MHHARRVFVTGVGIVSALGNYPGNFWNNLILGRSAVKQKEGFYVAEIEEENNGLRFISFALKAAELALKDSIFHYSEFDRRRIGVVIGTGLSGINDILMTIPNNRKISPRFISSILASSPASEISRRFGFMGPCRSPSTACTGGLHAIMEGTRLIRDGVCDAVIVGATEACINNTVLQSFKNAKALCRTRSVPFDKQRNGFALAEGASVLVLQSESVQEPYCEISGFGEFSEAWHPTAPHPDGIGAENSMISALRETKSDVDYVNAHATGTILGDPIELLAFKRIFESLPCISSIKFATGHLLSASAALEVGACSLAIKNQIIPPNTGLTDPIDESVDFVPRAKAMQIKSVLVNSFGFGGICASLLLNAPTFYSFSSSTK